MAIPPQMCPISSENISRQLEQNDTSICISIYVYCVSINIFAKADLPTGEAFQPIWDINSFFFFFLFRAILAAYGSSQTRSRIRATAAGLHHSHSNTGSELCLQPTLQLAGIQYIPKIKKKKPKSIHLIIQIVYNNNI